MWARREPCPSYPQAAQPGRFRPAFGRPGRNGAARCCTSRQRKTHKTEVRSVYYPWHPWYGRSLVIRESLVKGGLAVYRCCLEVNDSAAKSLEIPQWMFDRAICCGLRQAERPMADCAALLRLKALLSVASVAADEMVIEAQHRSSIWKGDADAKVRSPRSHSAAGSVPPPSKQAGVARLTHGGERANDAVARPDAADESSAIDGARRRRREPKGRGR